MIFIDSEEYEEKRKKLKNVIADGKREGKHISEIKRDLLKADISIMNVFANTLHLKDYLELSNQEYLDLELPIWM